MNKNTKIKFQPYITIIKIAALWGFANFGYYIILPKFGLSLSYNLSPVYIALYFLAWTAITIWYFKNTLSKWMSVHSKIWLSAAYSLGVAIILCGVVYLLSLLPILQGPLKPPYTDLLFATPWYFLPKSIEILIQQLLITVFIAEFYFKYHSLKKVIIGYIICFAGAHVILFLLNGSPAPYAIIMTAGAFLSAFVIPYFILKIKRGFVYAYTFHFIFYIILALLLHAWPPPGYFA